MGRGRLGARSRAGPCAQTTNEGSRMTQDVQHQEWPLWEVFVRSKAGLDHKHCGSLHAPDPKMALQMARDVYTRRQEGVSVWVVRSDQIVASDPGDKDMYFDPAEDKVYRHPTFYALPKSVDHM
ncbi:1,2-phenylacetyl-CoA epoxidase subunit PaaB [Variovorax sp. PBL-E5]|uniref:1,2-phenylacetyl-CoA epoxidase subunit PaaB n=1 Tax=unclassified Variovorax TaxID=663243 RepID=UPI003FCCCBD6